VNIGSVSARTGHSTSSRLVNGSTPDRSQVLGQVAKHMVASSTDSAGNRSTTSAIVERAHFFRRQGSSSPRLFDFAVFAGQDRISSIHLRLPMENGSGSERIAAPRSAENCTPHQVALVAA